MQHDTDRATSPIRWRRGAVAVAFVALVGLTACSSEQTVRTGGTKTESTADDTSGTSAAPTTDETTDVSTDVSTDDTKATLPPITGSTVRPTTTPAPTTEPTTPPPATLEAAQQQYFLISAASNAASQELWGRYPDGVPWAEFPGVCAQAQAIDEKFAADLRAYTGWPANAVDAIDALAAFNEGDAELYAECAATDPADVDALRDVDGRLGERAEAGSTAADDVRIALELPLDRG